MNYKLYYLLIVTLILSCQTENNKDLSNKPKNLVVSTSSTNSYKKYKLETGIITYKSKMLNFDIKTKLYFTDYGENECNESVIEMFGKKNTTRNFIKKDYLYTINLEQGFGSKQKVDSNYNLQQIDFRKFDDKFIKNFNAKEIGEEFVIEKKCKIYSLMFNEIESKYWVWNSIILKMEAEQDNIEIILEAVKIEENIEIPKDIFEIPKEMKIQDISVIMKKVNK